MDVVELLQRLIRFDTTNPPGEEEACVAFVESLLESAGIACERYEKAPGRPNLVARHAGDGDGPPLLLYGHVDVVTTEGQPWTRPPFAGELADGDVWGRGALDMKGGVAMIVRAFLDAHERRAATPLVLCVLSDEENGGDLGAAFLADEHPEAFGGARHALGEFGGTTQWVGGRPIYPIQVAEKQIGWLRATARGPAGHGALGVQGSATGKLGRFLAALEERKLPVHVTPIVEQWFTAMADALPEAGDALRALLDPDTTDAAVEALGARGRQLDRVLRNTVSPTILHGGTKINVVPASVQVELDGRILPGFTPDDLIAEVHALAGDEVELELVRHDPGPPEPDLAFYEPLAGILRELDPDAIPVPMLQAGVTDARHLARAGIQTYGWLPLRLPQDFDLWPLVHNADERVPADALAFGVEAISLAIDRYEA